MLTRFLEKIGFPVLNAYDRLVMRFNRKIFIRILVAFVLLIAIRLYLDPNIIIIVDKPTR